MKRAMTVLAVVLMAMGGMVQADWAPGDGHKMHFPQLPDPNGWDVDVLTDTVYDDFLCTGTGPIEDVHFWVSWFGDQVGEISWIDISFHGDVPAGVDMEYSHPDSLMYGDPLWYRRFTPAEWSIAPGGSGLQGWYNPQEPFVVIDNHQMYEQINITGILDPFEQEEDKVYWIGIHIGLVGTETAIGWKTSMDHWNDDAVYYQSPPGWNELLDPVTQESLDMAFVITPEPTCLALLAWGGMMLSRRRR